MILSILDTSMLKKQAKLYLYFTLFILIFGFIYESFSHGVYTPYMYLAFIVPFILGVIIKLVVLYTKIKIPMISDNLYNAFINTLTIGSIFNGVLIIYGTTNSLIYIYWILSLLLLLLSILFIITRSLFE